MKRQLSIRTSSGSLTGTCLGSVVWVGQSANLHDAVFTFQRLIVIMVISSVVEFNRNTCFSKSRSRHYTFNICLFT